MICRPSRYNRPVALKLGLYSVAVYRNIFYLIRFNFLNEFIILDFLRGFVAGKQGQQQNDHQGDNQIESYLS